MNIVNGAYIKKGVLQPGYSHTLAQPSWKPDDAGKWIEDKFRVFCEQRYIRKNIYYDSMPYIHQLGSIVAAGDVFLLERDSLASKLNCSSKNSDIKLIILAYLKWGIDCINHFVGDFFIAIFDKNIDELFLVVDHNGSIPCYYSSLDDNVVYFSNCFQSILNNTPSFDINKELIIKYATDDVDKSNDLTCCNQVKKLPAAHYLRVTRHKASMHCYWSILELEKNLHCKSRNDYYDLFRWLFTEAVSGYLDTKYSVCSHLSGGLDSSSISAVAANSLLDADKKLYAITALPNNLSGPSYRPGWYYHESHLIKELVQQYSNIIHKKYYSNPKSNVFDKLSSIPWQLDRPHRNLFNMDWILGSIMFAKENNCRTLLVGGGGNDTISWAGISQLNFLKKYSLYMKKSNKILCHNSYYSYLNPDIYNCRSLKKLDLSTSNLKKWHQRLSGVHHSGQRSSGYALQLYYGLNIVDPTSTLRIKEFCYNTPQWVFRKGRATLKRRLLVREGLEGLVPSKIRNNPYRGEQAADWWLQYNHNILNWKERLETLSSSVSDLLWSIYDKNKIFSLIDNYHSICFPTREESTMLRCMLMRCIGLGIFCDNIKE